MNKFIVKAKNALANKKAEMYVSKAVWVVGVLIIGGLLVWGVYSIMGTTVLPSLQKQVQNFFTDADGIMDKSNGTGFTASGAIIGNT